MVISSDRLIALAGVWEPSPTSSLPALTAFSHVWMVPSGIPNSLAALAPPISLASFTACTLYSWSYLRATLNTSLFSWFYYEILENKLSTFLYHTNLGTNTPPQTAQRFKSLSRKISASSVPSSGKTAQRNHLQQTEKEIVCGQVQVSPSSRAMQLPSSQQQHSRRIRALARFRCAGVMR